MTITTGFGKIKKLENDCLDILLYAAKQNGRWVSLTEISDKKFIPQSTLRVIFSVAKRGYFAKRTDTGYIIHADIFDKIAKKYRMQYKIKKMKNKNGRVSWHVAAIGPVYNTDI